MYQSLQPQIIYQAPTIQTPPFNPAQITLGNLRSRVIQNWRSAMVIHQPISISSNQPSRSHQQSLGTGYNQNPSSQNYLSLLVSPEDAAPSIQETNQRTLTNNILPTTIFHNKSLAVIFPFKLKEPSVTPLFNEAVLEEKLITAMYTDVKVDDQFIKLILNSRSVGSIITKQLMDQLDHRVDRTASTCIITADEATKIPIGEIDNLPIEINGIIMSIKVFVIKATQYQALIGNDWLSKTNVVLD
ncbi:hypothetical protein G9A89_018692 [Geosiphon pyriformis]|nr:hypothetical protein G9A89_018692 [Geosiphon pyriformis]